jgi:hypothetical protein
MKIILKERLEQRQWGFLKIITDADKEKTYKKTLAQNFPKVPKSSQT